MSEAKPKDGINEAASSFQHKCWDKPGQILPASIAVPTYIPQTLTLRQWYAGLAMQAIISNHSYMQAIHTVDRPPTRRVVGVAFDYADAMIAHERNNGGNKE